MDDYLKWQLDGTDSPGLLPACKCTAVCPRSLPHGVDMSIFYLCLMRMRNRAHLIQSSRKVHKGFLYKTLHLACSFVLQCNVYFSGRIIYVFLPKSRSWKWLQSWSLNFIFPFNVRWFNTHAAGDWNVSCRISAKRLQLKDGRLWCHKTTNEKSSELVSFAAFRTHIVPRHFFSYGYSLIDVLTFSVSASTMHCAHNRL